MPRAVAADRLASRAQAARDDVRSRGPTRPLSWTSSQSGVGQVERRAHRAGQPDGGRAAVADPARCGRRPADRGRSCSARSTASAARRVGERRPRACRPRRRPRRRSPAGRSGGRPGLPGDDPVLDVARSRTRRAVGVLDRSGPGSGSRRGRSSGIRARPDRRRGSRSRRSRPGPRWRVRPAGGERRPEVEVAERAVLVDAHDVADRGRCAGGARGAPRIQVDRHRSGRPRRRASVHDQRYVPGPTQVLGQRVRPAARGARGRDARRRDGRPSRRRGTSSTSWVAAARSAARRWVAETWRGSVELDPQAACRAASRQLEPADVGVAAVLLRPDVRDVLVGRRSTRQRPTSPPRFRSGYVSCGPAPNQRNALEPAATVSRTVPTRGRSASSSGMSTVSSTAMPPSASGRYTLPRAATTIPPRSRTRSGRRSRRRRARSPTRRRSSRSRPAAPPSGRPCRRSGRCRSARATATRVGGGGEERVDEAAVGVELDGALPVGTAAGAPQRASGAAARAASWSGADLEPGRRPGDSSAAVAKRTVSQASPRRPIDGSVQPGRPPRRARRARASAARTSPVRTIVARRSPAPSARGASRGRGSPGGWRPRRRPAATVVAARRCGPARRVACAPTSPASGGGPARPARRARSCRRSGVSPKSPP